MSEELKPCPFKHFGATREELEIMSFNSGYYHCVICFNCNTRGPTRRTKKQAIVAWNTRKPSAPSPVLPGGWRHSHGMIFRGTLRIARADFDTNPSPEFCARVFDDICAAMNRKP